MSQIANGNGGSTALVGAYLMLAVVGVGMYFVHDKVVSLEQQNSNLRRMIASLQEEVTSTQERVIEAGTVALRREADQQLERFAGILEARLQRDVIASLRVKRLTVVDAGGRERIVLGIGNSVISGDPNAFISVASPEGHNPIILSATDRASTVSVSKRAFMSGAESGSAQIALHPGGYQVGQRAHLSLLASEVGNGSAIHLSDGRGAPRLSMSATREHARLLAFEGGQPTMVLGNHNRISLVGFLGPQETVRSAMGSTADGKAFSEMYSSSGQLVYAVHTGLDPYANTLVKSNPRARAWGAASAFSTINTFWNLFRGK